MLGHLRALATVVVESTQTYLAEVERKLQMGDQINVISQKLSIKNWTGYRVGPIDNRASYNSLYHFVQFVLE